MLWPCKQNALGKIPQTSFASQSKWKKKKQLDDLELDEPITLRILDGIVRTSPKEVMEDREVWQLNLELLPQQPSRESGQ